MVSLARVAREVDIGLQQTIKEPSAKRRKTVEERITGNKEGVEY